MWRLGSYRDDPGADSGVFTKGGGGFKINYRPTKPPPLSPSLTFSEKNHKRKTLEKREDMKLETYEFIQFVKAFLACDLPQQKMHLCALIALVLLDFFQAPFTHFISPCNTRSTSNC